MHTPFEALRDVYKFAGFTEDELQQIFAAHEKVSFYKSDFLLKEGNIPNEYFVLQSGLVRSFVRDYQGNDITTNFFTSHHIIIEVVSLFQRTRSKENIEALTDCECWKIDFNNFQELFIL